MAMYRHGEITRMKEFGVLLPSKNNHEGQAQRCLSGKRLCLGLEASEFKIILSCNCPSRNEMILKTHPWPSLWLLEY